MDNKKKVVWSFCDDTTFIGYTDNTKWNGFDNIYVDEETHLQVIDYIAADYNYNFEQMFSECDLDKIEPNNEGLYCYGYGMTTQIIKEVL